MVRASALYLPICGQYLRCDSSFRLARATGQLAKTDAIDAQVLALFAERGRPTPRPLRAHRA
jgi:hypothetical protein